jgi:hypothetical protein
MSIATDEAEKRYPFNKEASSDDELLLNDDNGLKNEGYIAGSTSEPTEAEIEAAAKELFERRVFNHWGEEPGRPWSEQRNGAKEMWRKDARWALVAARKAVTE